MQNKNIIKQNLLFSDFIYKIYNYYIVTYNKFLNNIISNKNIYNKFEYYILIRGIQLIEKIFIYNIYINISDIEHLQNIIKKVIDLYFKFLDQLICMNNNIQLNIKDCEIFIYKKFISKSLNDFKSLEYNDINYINIIKINNKYLLNNINQYNNNNNNNNNNKLNINNILNYYKDYNNEIKNLD